MRPKLHHKLGLVVYPIRASAQSEVFFPFANHDLCATSGFRIDTEIVNQSPGSRQAESKGLCCAEASRKRPVEVCNSGPVIHKFKLQAHFVSAAQDSDSCNAFLSMNPHVP